MIVEFGEWLPDQPPLNNPGCNTIVNALPHPQGYQPFPGFVTTTNALDSRPLGAYAVRSSDRITHTLAGDAAKLYRLEQGVWGDVSKAGGYLTGERWEGVQWRDEFYMTNRVNPIQTMSMKAAPYQFQDLGATQGDIPQATHMDVVRDFLVTGNVLDVDGDNPFRVRWSAFNNPNEWVPGTNQSDFQDMRRDGFITGLKGGDYGVIFQERAISRMDYVGLPIIFDFNRVEKERGTSISSSIVQFSDDLIAYLGRDGFYIFDGQRSTPIGDGKIDKSFYRDLDQPNQQRISATVDTINQILLWAYPGPGAVDGLPNRILAYNYSQAPSKARWSVAEVETQLLVEFLSESYTLEGLNAVSMSLDALPFSLDSRVWVGGNLITAAFDGTNAAGGFTGTPYTAFLETREFSPIEGRRARVHKIRPVIDSVPGDMIAQIGWRNRAQDPIQWGREAMISDTGDASVRANGRYFRCRVKMSGSFDHALGIEPLDITDAGSR